MASSRIKKKGIDKSSSLYLEGLKKSRQECSRLFDYSIKMRKENIRKAQQIYESKYEKPRRQEKQRKKVPNILSSKFLLKNGLAFPSIEVMDPKNHQNLKSKKDKGSSVKSTESEYQVILNYSNDNDDKGNDKEEDKDKISFVKESNKKAIQNSKIVPRKDSQRLRFSQTSITAFP